MTIELSEDDKFTLILTLGYAAGAYMKQEGAIPKGLKRLTNKVLVQTGGTQYFEEEETNEQPNRI